MKNSKEYTKKVQRLYRSLKRKHPKVQEATYEDPADALVYATISENMSKSQADAAIKRLGDYFIDLNDLRVSRTEEIVELLGEDTPVTQQIDSTITRALGDIFNAYHRVSLEALKKMGKRPARGVLEKMDGISRFAVDYCMLTALEGHAIPLTKRMIEYLRSNELVHPGADEQEIGGFLAKQIAAKNGYEFYGLLRRESEARGRRKKKKTTTVRKKKSKKTTKTKKKTKKARSKT